MKIERAKLKKSNSELPEACRPLRDNLVAAKDDKSMCEVLKNVKAWEYGKSELFHWVDVLDRFDDVMERCCLRVNGNKWMLACDQPENVELKQLMLQVMRFTSMLIEYSFQRHSYESMDHLVSLLSSSDMDVVLEVLNVLYVFSKRSNFMGRLSIAKKNEIVVRLQYLAESWGGKENGFGLAECCQSLAAESYPSSATTVHFEFYISRASKTQPSNLCTIHLEHVDKLRPSAAQVMTDVLAEYEVPESKQMLLFTHIRLAHCFSKFAQRTNCILARLQAISVLVYSHAGDNDVAHQIIYTGFINELVNVLELTDDSLIIMKAAVLRTLTAIIHLERNPKLESIIDVTGANTYHGFLPSLVRKCIQQMIEPSKTAFPHSFSTALFSFLYHLASYESGGEALLSCGIMPSLLQLASWHSEEQEHITFVTRAVRIIDLMTNMCTQSFENHNGLKVFIDRLEHEVVLCKQEQPYVIQPSKFASLTSIDTVAMDVSDSSKATAAFSSAPEGAMQTDQTAQLADLSQEVTAADQLESCLAVRDEHEPMDSQPANLQPSVRSKEILLPVLKTGLQCLPQRSALLKSILNFFKKVIPEPTLSFADSIRHLMEGSLPKALQHIISNAEYYGASLFLLALDVVTVFVFQEPSMLSSLQDKGLTDILLYSLLEKEIPTTREVLAALPNVFSALCLNQRGLAAFEAYQPFDRLFTVLLSPEYLPAMRKRKSSDTFGDTASNLGTAMDELMRHQNSLKVPAIKAIIGLLKEIIRLGTDPMFVCTTKASETVDAAAPLATAPSTQGNSDIESEDDDEVTEGVTTQPSITTQSDPVASGEAPAAATAAEAVVDEQAKPSAPKLVPLMDYILNVMKFVDAIMGNTTADDHCAEFINLGGLEPLFSILKLPNLPVDFSTSPACQSVSSVCTIILKLCHEPKVLEEGLKQLSQCLGDLEKLYEPLPPPGGSVLLSELASALTDGCTVTEVISNAVTTPLLHTLAAVQAYVKVFIHMCRFGQADLRQISLAQWSSENGMSVLGKLGKLYYTLVWEGTVLLAVSSENDLLPPDSDFGRADMAKLLPKGIAPKDMDTDSNSSLGVSSAMEGLSTGDFATVANINGDEEVPEASGSTSMKRSSQLAQQAKQIRPLLNVSSRLGSTLAELFQNVLVKICVGSVMLRQRRTVQAQNNFPVPSANSRTIVHGLSKLSLDGLRWTPPTDAHLPKLKTSFLMCAVGFTLPMLFEESKRSYHLMLQEFINVKGHEAFFDVFEDVLNLLSPSKSAERASATPSSFPQHVIEFLDTWLLLAEKLVHPKYILESIYQLPEKGNTSHYIKFNPTNYLKDMLKPVFNCVMRLWNHDALTNTQDADGTKLAQMEQVASSLLTILCHIIQAEKIIKEKEENVNDSSKSKGTSTSTAGATGPVPPTNQPTTRPGLAPLSEDNTLLRDLMDMGFSRERCVEALNFTSTVEQATEYLITHMIAGTAAGGHSSGSSTAMEMSLTEDEQIRAAIELSLSSVSNAQENKDGAASSQTATDKTTASLKCNTPLTSGDLDDLTDNLVPACMAMLDSMPNTVFKICQLIVIAFKRNGDTWREEMFKQLFLQIMDSCTLLVEDTTRSAWGNTQDEAVRYFKRGEKNLKLASRMHLLTLLIQEVDAPCTNILQENGFITSVLDLIAQCLPGLRIAGAAGTPQWLAPLMLVIDQCEKAAVASKRKAEAIRVLGKSSGWKWFDDRSGRWCPYNAVSNGVIDSAYKSGETSVRFAAGRRKYIVQFNAMLQLNEESGNRRPVMLCRKESKEKVSNSHKDMSGTDLASMETDIGSSKSLLAEQMRTLIRCCVDLISVPVECETLHAVLRLCLRCTRFHDSAEIFVNSGGIDQLLALSHTSSFTGFTSICTLIIRHILEDEDTLKFSMLQVLKEVSVGVGSSLCGVSSSSMGCKEIHYVMRQLGPAMCRNSNLIKNLALDNLRISLSNGKEPSWSSQHQVDIVAPVANKLPPWMPTPSESFRKIITSLLNILIVPFAKEDADKGGSCNIDTQLVVEKDVTSMESAMTSHSASSQTSLLEGLLATAGAKSSKDTKTQLNTDSSHLDKPLLSKSCVLRMLSEFIRSYPHCVSIITQHTYLAGQTDLITESCTALTFIFDKLLPGNQEDGDKDCPALSKILFASVASCNQSPDGQVVLVNELKASLQRTLAMPEVTHKYTHIQSLTGLVNTLVEACPSSPGQVKPPHLWKTMPHNSMNQMVKLMVKKGLISDLARIAHSIDLSNPSAVSTINALLKPLETLSRIVNQPQLAPAIANKPPTGRETLGTTVAAAESDVSATAQPQSNEVSTNADSALASVPDNQTNNDPSQNAILDSADIADGVEEFDTSESAMTYRVEPEQLEQQNEMLRAELDEEDGRLLNRVHRQVNEVLEQALDEILSQGLSDNSHDDDDDDEDDDDDMERVNDVNNVSDMDDVARDEDDRAADEVQPYHENEEDDTTEDEEEDDDDDDEDDEIEEGAEAGGNGAGELGMDEDEGWSDDDDAIVGETGRGLANILALEEDDDLFSRLEAYDPLTMDHGLERPRILVADSGTVAFRTLPVPMGNADMDNMAEESAVSLPPAPNSVPITHPLMNPRVAVSTDANRSHTRFMPGLARTRRPAGTGRAVDRLGSGRMNYGLQMMQQAPHNNLFHRLFGTGVAANILQLTTRLGAGGATRLYISDDDPLRSAASRHDDEPLHEFLQDGMEIVKNSGGPGILNNVPSTLCRWIEECRVLDGPSVHDVIAAVKEDIVERLLADKKQQIEATKEKEKEAKAAEAAKTNLPTTASTTVPNAVAEDSREPEGVRDLDAAMQSAGATSHDRDSDEVLGLEGRIRHQNRESSEFLHSIHALLLGEEDLAQDVARLYNSRQELRTLMSVPHPQPHINSTQDTAARRITSSINGSANLDTASGIGVADVPNEDELGPAVPSDQERGSQSAGNSTPLTASFVPPSSTQSLSSRLEQALVTAPVETPSAVQETVRADSANQARVGESLVEQDRACTPPNIFYDGDEPAPLPETENIQDQPALPPLFPTLSAVTPDTAASSLLLEIPLQSVPSLRATTVSVTSTNATPSTGTVADATVGVADATVGVAEAAAAATVGATPSDYTNGSTLPPLNPSTLAATAVENSSAPEGSSGSSSASNDVEASLPPGLEGVDPSFLEALPESIRREVIAEQLRLTRVQNQVREASCAAVASSITTSTVSTAGATASTSSQAAAPSTSAEGSSNSHADVSAEFLAALPPAIQEEVLAVQMAEQARQAAVQAGPDNSQDPSGFLNSLPPTLRQQVLADMDDSQISVLPADLMAEAHLLRGELEDRNRRFQNQMFPGNSSLGSILRQTALGGRGVNQLSASRFLRRGVGGGLGGHWSSNSSGLRSQARSGNVVRRGRQLLDQEGLACLLVLLFLDEPRLNVSRLHRIFKNLGYHSETLHWMLRALISILVKTNQSKEIPQLSSKQQSQSAWLSFGMDAALGCRANVFQVQHSSSSKRSTSSSGSVTIHPQAAQLVCQHVMDTLIYLSKTFTHQFLPNCPSPSDDGKDSTQSASKERDSGMTSGKKSPKQPLTPSTSSTSSSQSFWDVLVRLDQMRLTRKGKGVQRMSTSFSFGQLSSEEPVANVNVEESALGQLMALLSSPVIRRSPALTDRLLKLLSSISTAISPESASKSAGNGSHQGSPWLDSGESSSVQPKQVISKNTVLLPDQLRLAVEVLTSKSCSEEGLEDSTKLLLRLSNANQATKETIVKLLLSGAQQIGHAVCLHIESLLKEAQKHNTEQKLSGEGSSTSDLQGLEASVSSRVSDSKPSTSSAGSTGSSSMPSRGLIPDRYNEGSVVMIAPPKTKARSHDLQLPSMSLLTSKSSSQQFLLRLLKVIIQLSDKKNSTADASSSGAAQRSVADETTFGAASGSQGHVQDAAEATNHSVKMEVDDSNASAPPPVESEGTKSLCDKLDLDKLWEILGLCLTELSRNNDHNAVLMLQPAVESFFLVHAGHKENISARSRRDRVRREDQLSHLNLDEPPASPASPAASSSEPLAKADDSFALQTKKFLKFAETHRTVLNQILRQSQTPLSDGPFSVLVEHMKLLDFDVKNRYFKAELQKLDEGMRREDVPVHVRRDHVFEDSYRELFRRTPEDWKHRLYIVFEGEEGQDAGGLLREWYLIMSREIFNPNYALFMTTPQDRVTYTINQLSYYNSEHLSYFRFVGRIIAKAIYDNKLLDCYFTRSFYKHITGQPVRYTDMEAEDYSFYQGLEFLLDHDIGDLGYELTFSTEIQELGVTQSRELKPNGANITVTEANKKEYVKLVCQLKMTGAIRQQLNAFLEGFYDIIPKYLISIFNEQELELLISGLPTVDVDDLKANTEYHKYNASSLQIIWLWRALRSFDQAERARFLQFVTGTSKVPLQGFAYLEGMNGTQKFQIHRDDRSTDRLPCAHTCFNQLDLPAYETFDKLKRMLLLVISECSEGFGLA